MADSGARPVYGGCAERGLRLAPALERTAVSGGSLRQRDQLLLLREPPEEAVLKAGPPTKAPARRAHELFLGGLAVHLRLEHDLREDLERRLFGHLPACLEGATEACNDGVLPCEKATPQPAGSARAPRRVKWRAMTEEEIRAILASVEPSTFIDRTPGTVALLRSRVEEAGGDPDAVGRWVEAHGGRLDRTMPYRIKGQGPRYGRKETSGQDFYVVPVEALEG